VYNCGIKTQCESVKICVDGLCIDNTIGTIQFEVAAKELCKYMSKLGLVLVQEVDGTVVTVRQQTIICFLMEMEMLIIS
jgi:hypothetical protein